MRRYKDTKQVQRLGANALDLSIVLRIACTDSTSLLQLLLLTAIIECTRDTQRPLEVASSGDARFAGSVELAVRFGKTLLLLEVLTLHST
jgi:hypothetical protein